MRGGDHRPTINDAADWSRASYRPEPEREVLLDILQEAAARWKGSLPATRREFVLVVASIALAAIRESGAEVLEELEETDAPMSGQMRETISRIVAEMIYAEDPVLYAKCLDQAFGLGIQGGLSHQDIGDQHGVGRAAVSKRCVEMTEDYDIGKGSGAMRGLDNREKCRQRELGKPPRERRAWTLGAVLKTAIPIEA